MLILVSAVLFGGASRTDVGIPLVARVVAILSIAWLIWRTPFGEWRFKRTATWLLACLILVPVAQLIPLPWSIWTALPGRDYAANVYRLLGERPQHAISLTPDRTINALSALAPAVAGYLACLRLGNQGRAVGLTAIMLLALFSGILGLVQVTTGPDGGAYFYTITNSDSSVGFFSNANHQSLFLCIGIVVVMYLLAELTAQRPHLARASAILAAAAIGIMMISILETKSRAGAAMSIIAILGGASMVPARSFPYGPKGKLFGFAGVGAVLILLLILGYTGTLFGHSLEIEKLDNARISNLPVFFQIIRDYFPFGSGLGSFEVVFRSYEDISNFNYDYLNNTHNDYIQILIETGLIGGALLLIFLTWWTRAFFIAWTSAAARERGEADTRLKRTAGLITFIALLHSLADYPLRTAALSTVFAFCIAILTDASQRAGEGGRSSPAALKIRRVKVGARPRGEQAKRV
ncbi:MAG: O-antigen ligase family protein [Sphingomonas sp.]